ncbi:MAG TPA: hypothetical protein VLM79_24150 [Kofleriaceae bacterium]|nr:hypothetical protein [Kofleriaceae bacterium]
MRARAFCPGVRFPVRRGARVHAALTALAFVLSSLFGLIHEGTTRHVRCAEHGELIDGGPAVAGASSTVASHARLVHAELERGAAVRDLDAIAPHGHEHCALASALRESRVVPRAPGVAPAPIAVGSLELAAASASVAHHRDLFRTAPKTSPPV